MWLKTTEKLKQVPFCFNFISWDAYYPVLRRAWENECVHHRPHNLLGPARDGIFTAVIRSIANGPLFLPKHLCWNKKRTLTQKKYKASAHEFVIKSNWPKNKTLIDNELFQSKWFDFTMAIHIATKSHKRAPMTNCWLLRADCKFIQTYKASLGGIPGIGECMLFLSLLDMQKAVFSISLELGGAWITQLVLANEVCTEVTCIVSDWRHTQLRPNSLLCPSSSAVIARTMWARGYGHGTVRCLVAWWMKSCTEQNLCQPVLEKKYYELGINLFY